MDKKDDDVLTLEELEKKFPNTDPEYLENIVKHLEKDDWDILDGVKDKPDYIEARKRLEILCLEKFDQPYDFKKYQNNEDGGKVKAVESVEEINYQTLNHSIDNLIGKRNEKHKFILGGLAQKYLKTEGLMELNKENQKEASKHNQKLRKQEAKKIYEIYQKQIDAIREGDAKISDVRYLFDQLKNEHLEVSGDKNKARDILKESNKAIPSEGLLQGEIGVQIWDRDPSKDLSCSYGEFFACAFLGGVNDWGSPKYLRNGAISMIDFGMINKDEEERIARAITGAAIEKEGSKLGKKTYMLVDSVEGSDRLNPNVVLEPILEYAQHCGFDGVMFNTGGTMNSYPTKVIEAIDEIVAKAKKDDVDCKFKDAKRNLQLIYSKGAEYFEGFGSSGGIIGEIDGYVVDFEGDSQ